MAVKKRDIRTLLVVVGLVCSLEATVRTLAKGQVIDSAVASIWPAHDPKQLPTPRARDLGIILNPVDSVLRGQVRRRAFVPVVI